MIKLSDEDIKVIAANSVKYLKDRAKKSIKIIKNRNYIEWLKEFSKKYPYFDSQTLAYNEKVTEKEQTKASFISLLIDAIDSYCEKTNEAKPIIDESSTFTNFHFNIKDGDFEFSVGRIFGQGCLEYFELGVDKSEQIINFKDLINYSQHLNENNDDMENI